MSAIVEGSLIVNDDDTSDEESLKGEESDTESYHEAYASETVGRVAKDDDEEDLEVFVKPKTDAAAKFNALMNNASKNTKKASLVDAMAASVDAVETGKPTQQIGFHMPQQVPEIQANSTPEGRFLRLNQYMYYLSL